MAKGRVRRQPQRTCIGCREVQTKRQLVRLVRTPQGQVRVDPTGKLAGRGAYLCQRESCWLEAKRTGAVRRALRVSPTEEELAEIDAHFARYPMDEQVQAGETDD